MSSLAVRALSIAAFSMAALSCADSPTGPLRDLPVANIRLSDTLFTRSGIIRAVVDVPAGYALRAGSVRWSVASGTATISPIAGTSDSVEVVLTTAGTVALRVAYTLTSAGSGSTISIGTPSRRVPGDVTVETERTITVASPRLAYGALPSGLVAAGTPLGGVRVDIRDASGRLMTNATDSIVIALDPTSGTPGATLLGTAAARAVGGSASFPGLSIRRSGSAYRLIASSPTITARDTATTFVVAGAPSAATSSVAVLDSVRAVGQTTTVTVTLRDEFGNPVTGATSTQFAGAATLGTLGGFTCVSGVCTATYTATTVGSATVAVTIGGVAVGGSPAPVRVTAGPAARLAITGASTQAAGSAQLIAVTAFDNLGNIATSYAGPKSLTFSGAAAAPNGATLPTVTATNFGVGTNITFVNGVATGLAMTLVKVETALVAATDGTISAAGTDRLSVTVTAGAADPATSTITVVDSVVAQGGTTIVRITLLDRFGNPVTAGTAPTVSATPTSGTLGAFTCVNGVCSATYTGTTLGTSTITGSIGGTPMPTTTSVRVTAGAAAKFVITGAGTQVAGATQNITITAVDANGNTATAYTGTKNLTFSGASVSPNLDAPTTGAIAFGSTAATAFVNGVATAVPLQLFAAETAIIATTDGSIAATGGERLTVVVSADNASPAVSDLQASPATIAADGVATSVLTLQLKDAYGNPTPNVANPGTVSIEQTAGTGTLVANFTSIGGGAYTQTVTSAASAGSGTFRVRLNGTIGSQEAVVTYVAAGGVLSRLVCTLSQAAAQSAASSTTVALCGATAVGDLEIVTLALDGVDDVVAPSTPADGNWVKISSTLQSSGSGGNKPMLLVLYARRYAAGNSRSVTFTAATQHKWSVDMVTFVSSGGAVPSGGDIIVSQNSSGAGLTTPGLTAGADNTVLYYVMGNSLTGNLSTPTPAGLTLLANNNTGGTSSASYMELLPTTGDIAPVRTWTNTKSANTVLVQLLVRP